MKKEIRWGIIGAGGISRKFVTALAGITDAKLMAIAARDRNRAEVFAKEFHIEKCYDQYEAMVCDPEIDVVYIGTINTCHYDQMRLCIEHGKAVICEKPFTLNRKQANEIFELAREKNVFVMEAMWTKFLPCTYQVKEWIDSKRIGEIKYIHADFGFAYPFDPLHRLYSIEKAGGALLDVGIYPITYACHMLGQLPIDINSTVVYAPTKVDAVNHMIFTFEHGTTAVLSSAVSVELGRNATIVGEHGRIEIPMFWAAEDAMMYDENNQLIDSFHCKHRVNGYEYEAMAVMKDISDGKIESTVHTNKHTLDILAIMDELRNNWNITYPQENKR